MSSVRSAPVPARTGDGAAFPGMGRRYIATFPRFRFELMFAPPASLTWVGVHDDGRRGRAETVEIQVDAVGDGVFLVSWQEANGTKVLQVEDFSRKRVFTHIARADGTLLRAQGTLIEVSAATE